MTTIKRRPSLKNSLLWHIETEGKTAIVAGTMHIAFPGYEKIVTRFVDALQHHDVTYYFGETDLNEMSAHAGSLTSDFKRLSDQMSTQRFLNYRKKLMHFTGLDLSHYDLLPPMLLSSLIASKLIQYHHASIDEILWQHAEMQGAKVCGLEAFEEQLEIFHRIPYDYQVKQVKKLLSNLSKCRTSLNKLTDLYQNQSIHQLYIQGKRTLGPIRDLMLKERNDRMVERMKANMLTLDGNCYFSFGAAHLAGKYGILHGLKSRGCRVSPLKTERSRSFAV